MTKSQKEKTYSCFNKSGSTCFALIRDLILSRGVKGNLLLVFFCAFFYQSNAQPGSVDLSFGNNGEVFTLIGDNNIYYTQVKACSVLPDGKILVAGYYQVTGADYYCKLFILKFNQDGSIDNDFGYSGKMEMWVAGYMQSQLQDMVIQPDGKIFLAVNLYPSSSSRACIIRLYSNGLKDDSFGDNGYLYSDSKTSYSKIAFLDDGKIIVCGTDFTNQGMARHALYRFNEDWSVDTVFGNNGNFYGWHGQANSVKIQPDGKILIGGLVMSGVKAIARITRATANGEMDLEFGSYGFYDLPEVLDCVVNDLELQADNKILVGTSAYNGIINQSKISRLNTNGTLDTSFGDEGSIITCSEQCNGYGLNVLPDGKIVSLEGTGICRLNNDGSIDESFGQSGHHTFGVEWDYPKVCSILGVQNDSKIISTGVHYDPVNYLHRVYITRLNNGTLGVNSFDNDRFEIYPIPCSDKLYLKTLTQEAVISKICIYNLQGISVLNLFPDTQDDGEIDLSEVNPGHYLVNIHLVNGNVISKLIIKN